MSEFDKYLEQTEPGRAERAGAWRTAIGLQDVDGLRVSPYLVEQACRHIEGEIGIDGVSSEVREYYEARERRADAEGAQSAEADKVSVNIVKLLGEDAFSLTPIGLASVHRRVFEGVFPFAGEFRTCNLTKREWVLDGDTVRYTPFTEIAATLHYDIERERTTPYGRIPLAEAVERIARFTAGIWQIHPFREGNTRATAVFIIKYLRTLGFEVGNELFERKSWYFRNALVRANYQNVPAGIAADFTHLDKFFKTLLLGENHELHNRDMKITR